MAAKQAMKENLQCTSKYGHLRISQDICHVRMTDIEGFLTIYGHNDNLLNNNWQCLRQSISIIRRHRGGGGLVISCYWLIMAIVDVTDSQSREIYMVQLTNNDVTKNVLG